MFAFEQCEWDGVGVVGLQQAFLFVLESVTVGGQLVQLIGFGGHEPVELVVEHSAESFLIGSGDLHVVVVVLDELFDVFDKDGTPGAVGAFGVPA